MKTFSQRNRERCESPRGFNKPLSSWSLSDWFMATLGELGEAANVGKKLKRLEGGARGTKETREELRVMLKHEIADCACYLDLLAQSEGFDLDEIREEKFQIINERIGYVE